MFFCMSFREEGTRYLSYVLYFSVKFAVTQFHADFGASWSLDVNHFWPLEGVERCSATFPTGAQQ